MSEPPIDGARIVLNRASEWIGVDHGDDPVWQAIIDLLDFAAVRWQYDFEATQHPSLAVDEPPSVHHGSPEDAAANASHHVRYELKVARAYLAARGAWA